MPNREELLNMSIEQDLNEHLNKEAEYQKSFEKECEKVASERSTIDAFLQEGLYQMIDEHDSQLMRAMLNKGYTPNVGMIILKYWDKYVKDEAKRNLE